MVDSVLHVSECITASEVSDILGIPYSEARNLLLTNSRKINRAVSECIKSILLEVHNKGK